MKLQAFIFNWPGKKQHAAILEGLFRTHCETTVINSDDTLRNRFPHWQHVGGDAYFTAQWNAAVERFDADVFVHIQADVWPLNVGEVLSESVRYIQDHRVGVYAPNVDFNAHFYRVSALPKLDEGVYEVPGTDCCFWTISGEVIRNMPRVDPRINRLGWGIEDVVGAVARVRGLKVVRDYRFTAGHEKGSGYNLHQAGREWQVLRDSLDPALRREMDAMEAERKVLRISDGPRRGIEGLLTAVRKRTQREALILHRRAMAAWQAARVPAVMQLASEEGSLNLAKQSGYEGLGRSAKSAGRELSGMKCDR
jgi:hypothetical protein